MRKCKRCKNEFKDEYLFCPKCGSCYYNNQKVTYSINHFNKIGDIILYVIGSISIVGFFNIMFSNFVSGFVGLLFAISLLPITYELLEGSIMNASDKTNKLVRILVPIVLLLVFVYLNSK
ncbi:MAG: hypothetical protein WBO70_03000 [Erysipelotrichaceae bacterium]